MAAESSGDAWGERWMRWLWRKPALTIGERARRRITVHLLPFLFFLYILAYLDRGNVSVAQLGMKLSPEQSGIGLTDDAFGHGAGLFFWGYWILEIPSTVSVARWGARSVFARILLLWGLCAALCGFIGMPLMHHFFGWLPQLSAAGPLGSVAHFITELPTNTTYQFYVFRFLLGFFEGGFFPTVIVFLSYWFRQQDRAKAIACFMAAIPFSSAVGVPLSGLIMKQVAWFGLTGWRWVYILEGVVPVLAGIVTLFVLPNRPREAQWLPDEERDWLQRELDEEHRLKKEQGHDAWKKHVGMVALLTLVYFGLNVSSYGLSMFMPLIVKSQTGSSDFAATLITGGYFTIAAIGILLNGWHSDKTGERIGHVCIPLALQGIGLILASYCDNVPILPLVILLTFVSLGQYSHLPAFWPIPTIFLGAIAAASAIGFINMVGNLGGYYGPNMVGKSVAGDIGWLHDYLKHDSPKVLNSAESARLRAKMQAADSLQAIAERRDEELQLQKIQLDPKSLEKVEGIAANVLAGGKLSAAVQLDVHRQLALVALQVPLSTNEADSLKEQLDRGASFASALRLLAPWPLMSALVILIVGYTRRRTAIPAT